MEKPEIRPKHANFSSGPCAKRPGWNFENLSEALLGRSHRADPSKKKLRDVIELHRTLLGIPSDYKIAIVPGSDTGAFEMAMWAMLGERGVDVFAWESFSTDWLKDITDHLKLEDVNAYQAGYGDIPDLSQADPARDCVFVWNGTTSGVRVPNGDWISSKREGLTFCDATSAVFAYDLPWEKLDVTTWSWQKVIGSEAAHGMIALSPRAVQRLESYVPDRPLPKLFRLTKGSGDNIKLNESIFEGATINTPSMLAVEDCLDALGWIEHIGGLAASIRRSEINYETLAKWVNETSWIDFLTEDEDIRSTTAVCLKITEGWFAALPADEQSSFINAMTKLLDEEGVAYDIKAYRDAPAGLRIWCGTTISSTDIEEIIPWINWAYEKSKADFDA